MGIISPMHTIPTVQQDSRDGNCIVVSSVLEYIANITINFTATAQSEGMQIDYKDTLCFHLTD